ncbi:hypothetical protein PAHAL_9G376900 [Panicum hallii]|uniref:Uncharacterized protein n=1 Tax=Panicum hallii TaxID=206008 RepID=A0A2S3ING9_9POAL|nr:hypothetical protein PAHAL_9G376900 [Panicum hallii]
MQHRPWTRQPPPVGRRRQRRPTASGTAAAASASANRCPTPPRNHNFSSSYCVRRCGDCARLRHPVDGLRPNAMPQPVAQPGRHTAWQNLPHPRRGPRQHFPRTRPQDAKVS